MAIQRLVGFCSVVSQVRAAGVVAITCIGILVATSITSAHAATLRVGPDEKFTRVADAARRARDGDIVEILPGEYRGDVATWLQKRLTIRGIGSRPVLIADGKNAEGKAIWVIRGGDFRVENIEFRGARASDNNGAGIRFDPHQLSGGMQQRIMVALATFLRPKVILADEPTTALDVVVQKDILILLMRLQRMMKNTIIFVSHDMGVHYQTTHKMMIMYAAKTVEYADTNDIFNNPLHPYTLMLTSSLPTIGDERARTGLPGRPPSLWDPPKGCRFAMRCPLATQLCYQTEPELLQVQPGHFSACHRVDAVPNLAAKMRQGPKLSEFAKDRELIATVESALKADETEGPAVRKETE